MRPDPLKAFLLPFVFAIALALCPAAWGQQRVRDTNANGWYMFFGDHRLKGNWGVHTEFQVRQHGIVTEPLQVLARGGANYYLSDGAFVTLGYLFVETWPYGDFPAPDSFPEHRIYQQLQYPGKIGRLALVHRYRLEQRWVGIPGSPDYRYLNRARYMFRTNVPFSGTTIDSNEFYLGLYDEIFVNFGNSVPNVFDQNRAYAALGYKLSREASLEVGYLHQAVQQRNRTVFEHNHTLQVALFFNLDRTQ